MHGWLSSPAPLSGVNPEHLHSHIYIDVNSNQNLILPPIRISSFFHSISLHVRHKIYKFSCDSFYCNAHKHTLIYMPSVVVQREVRLSTGRSILHDPFMKIAKTVHKCYEDVMYGQESRPSGELRNYNQRRRMRCVAVKMVIMCSHYPRI